MTSFSWDFTEFFSHTPFNKNPWYSVREITVLTVFCHYFETQDYSVNHRKTHAATFLKSDRLVNVEYKNQKLRSTIFLLRSEDFSNKLPL